MGQALGLSKVLLDKPEILELMIICLKNDADTLSTWHSARLAPAQGILGNTVRI